MEEKYFCAEGWTGVIGLISLRKVDVLGNGSSAPDVCLRTVLRLSLCHYSSATSKYPKEIVKKLEENLSPRLTTGRASEIGQMLIVRRNLIKNFRSEPCYGLTFDVDSGYRQLFGYPITLIWIR